jgi:methyl-accepting chemotaxis protein
VQKKLGAGFLLVALLYLMIGLGVPRLQLNPLSTITVTASSYLVIGLGAAWLISRLISRRMRTLAAAAEVIRDGDLTHRVEIHGEDEIAFVAHSFGVMSERLLEIVHEVQATAGRINESAVFLSTTSQELNTSTQEIANASQAIASGADQQASQVVRTTETTRELAAVTEQVARKAHSVHRCASEAAVRATGGGEDARRAADGIDELTGKNVTASEAIEGFRHKAGRIGDLINSITSISHQTHLLAINAGIEAARAGDEGRGFAVVAEEVSRLADNVRRFAEQISTISVEIMRGSQQLADQIRQSVRAAEDVSKRVERTLGSFQGILESIRGTADEAGDIYQLSEKQRAAAEEVNRSLVEISDIAERNARGTDEASAATHDQTVAMHEMARSAKDLARTSDQLRELVTVFKLH